MYNLVKTVVIKLIVNLSSIFKIDLYSIYLNSQGILNTSNTGEHEYLKNLSNEISSLDNPIIIDVGSNIGKYSKMVAKTISNSVIYCIEPNKFSFEILKKNLRDEKGNIFYFNVGLSSRKEIKNLNIYPFEKSTSHASVYKNLFQEFHNEAIPLEVEASFYTLDEFIENQKIQSVELLKIDTEGHELEVLKGAKKSLSLGIIKRIQFEFGECHVFSKVFLHDFFSLLPEYTFYRINKSGLINIMPYNVKNEIFRFQNIIAIKK